MITQAKREAGYPRGLRLRFKSAELEALYQAERAISAVPPLRIALGVGTCLYALFGVLDLRMAGDALRAVLVLRFGVIVPILAGAMALTYLPSIARWYEVVAVGAALSAALGVIAMTAMIGGTGASLYYAGLILTLYYGYTFLRVSVTVSALVGWLTFAIYWGVTSQRGAVAADVMFSNLFFLVATNLMGTVVQYVLERGERASFLDRRTIAAQAEHLETLLNEADVRREAAEQVARLDPLTGLYNRRYVFELAAYEGRRNRRLLSRGSFIVLDIDDFKAVNDKHGHHVGDDALCLVASSIRSALRASDTAARLGGDEFVVFCPDTPALAAEEIAHRVCSLVAQGTADLPCGALTISAGVASFGSEHETLEAVLEHADLALYEAKRQGRGKVVQSQKPASSA